jgi:hypothetical protein
MGHTTDFEGEFTLNKALTSDQRTYLLHFSETRRMRRDAKLAQELPDPVRERVGLPVGPEGAFFVGGSGVFGGRVGIDGSSVLDPNTPPKGQPELWCQWVPNECGTAILWDGGEKFYHYVEWLRYIIENFLTPWGLVLNGTVRWEGEERGDVGDIVVVENKVSAHRI